MRIWKPLVLLMLTTCFSANASAQIFYTEAANGDLGDPISGSPTILGVLGLGENTISGTLDNTFTFLDRDSFTFTVATGQQLNSLSFTGLDGESRFYALSNQDTALSTTTGGGNRYASLIGNSHVGLNLLDETVNDLGSGGTGPLAAGDYSFWLQETDFSVVNYSLSLTTATAVPEPGSAAALLCGGGLTFLRRRRRAVP